MAELDTIYETRKYFYNKTSFIFQKYPSNESSISVISGFLLLFLLPKTNFNINKWKMRSLYMKINITFTFIKKSTNRKF